MPKTILCFSRSYLSDFLPKLMEGIPDVQALHIVQSDEEQRKIQKMGHRVVLNLESMGRDALAADPDAAPLWTEPADMRKLTAFDWSPLYADRYLSNFSESVMLRVAGAIQKALEEIFAQHQIDGVLTEPVALFPTHYMLYLCKRLGIAPMFWANTYFPGYFYFVSDVHLCQPATLPAQSAENMQDLQRTVQSFVERVAQDKAGPVYHHKFANSKRGLSGYLRQRSGHEALVLSPSITTKAIQALRFLRASMHFMFFPRLGDYMTASARSEHKFYLRNVMGGIGYYDHPADGFDPKNVFFPLQFEPEASLLYAAPDFRNQAALVESILQTLPSEHVLWVKEHPNQFGALHHPQWRKLRKKYRNLRMVYGRQNGRQLIQNCALAVSITSTAGLDALIYGRRCIVLGDVFYRNFPGALPVRSAAEMATLLNDKSNYCATQNPDVEQAPLIAALVEFGRHCHLGDPQPSDQLYTDRNIGNLRSALLLALENTPERAVSTVDAG